MKAGVIRRMIEAGLPDEDIQAYIDGWLMKVPELSADCPQCVRRRSEDAARKRQKRAENSASASADIAHIYINNINTPEGDKKKKNIRTIPRTSADAEWEEWFEDIWGYYPRRKGANPKKPAKQKFFSLLKTCADPEALATEICKGAVLLQKRVQRDSVDPQFVPMMTTWLNQERWADEQDEGYSGQANGNGAVQRY